MMYFGSEVETAIAEYCTAENSRIKNRIFEKTIYPALNKLVENVFHDKKFYYQDAKHECVIHLIERLEKFDPTLGHKAFSYFNRVTINWIWAQMKAIGEEAQTTTDLTEVDSARNLDNELYYSEYQQELRDFCKKWSQWGNDNLDYLYFTIDDRVRDFTKKDKAVANAIFDLFSNSESIDIINKKALYIMIRERVDVSTQTITDVVKVLKVLCKNMFIDYQKNGTKYWHRHLYYPEESDMVI